MTTQEQNERTINLLWAIGDKMFDGMLAQITKQVEEAEQQALSPDRPIKSPGCDDLTSAIDEECELCGGTGEYTLGRSDSDWGEPVQCECQCKHDWRGIDTGRMCAKCHRIERAE